MSNIEECYSQLDSASTALTSHAAGIQAGHEKALAGYGRITEARSLIAAAIALLQLGNNDLKGAAAIVRTSTDQHLADAQAATDAVGITNLDQQAARDTVDTLHGTALCSFALTNTLERRAQQITEEIDGQPSLIGQCQQLTSTLSDFHGYERSIAAEAATNVKDSVRATIVAIGSITL